MSNNKRISRREFFKKFGHFIGGSILLSLFPGINKLNKSFASCEANIPSEDIPPDTTIDSNLFISKNGTPVTNMQKVIDMAGGIANFIGKNDVVVLKPNLQHSRQGYTHTEATKALIDIILNRQGGFTGEIIIAENVQFRNIDDTENCGWAATGDARERNWPDMNYNELITWYNNGYPNVTAAKMISSTWPNISGPSEGSGYVPYDYTITDSPGANGRVCRLSYPIIQSSYSGNLIDTKNGVWSGGSYTGQQVKLIFMPTLNNHGSYSYEDYAGATSAVKCHLGFVKMSSDMGGNYDLHHIGYDVSNNIPRAVGEAVGELITNVVQPTLYITVAEWTGWGGRTSDYADQTKTIGLCNNPVTLDYWMGKNVLFQCHKDQSFLDPSNDCNWRQTLEGCHAKDVGTLDETEMKVKLYDFNNRAPITRSDIEKKIMYFKEGSTTELKVKQLIDNYMKG